jgi:phage baseplate assembly protein W
MAGKGILLGKDGDLQVRNGSLLVGDSMMQEVSIILQMNQGEQKFFPALGANIIQLVQAKVPRFDIENRVKVHLALDGKSYDQIKEQIKTIIK